MNKKIYYLLFIISLGLFTACSDDDDSNESLITKMTFDNAIVVSQPTIDGTNIVFQISEDATAENLKELIPTIEISRKATVDPASGSKVDFSEGSVKFTVTAEDGKSKTEYNVSYQRVGKYDFEEWIAENTHKDPEMVYYAPVREWASCNPGVYFLKMFSKADRFSVTKSSKEDAYVGEAAARIETLQTNTEDGKGGALYPVVTTGTLFLGKFQTVLGNTLLSTKFGISYAKKPVAVKGHYKYTPGNKFYRCSDPEKYNTVTLEENTTDECAINAILYEIESDEDAYLTGVDAYTSDKLVAVAKLEDGTAKDKYTEFSIDLKYTKTYDPSKKYRFAIICSSSKYGDTFSGAPGSLLYVDDIEVISE